MQLCELPIKQIKISGDNPRIINKKSPGFRELVESIKAMGVKVPIHVRGLFIGDEGKVFGLLAGERRLLAAGEAGLDTIPALNHGDLTDEAAFEVTFAENFAREDLTILEQGKAVATLLDKYRGDAAAVASKMGKPERWVRQRELINSNLSNKWKKLVLEDSNYDHYTAAHLGLIARFPQHIQDGEIIRSLQYRGHLTVKELEDKLAELFLLLRKAPFDTDKCMNCQKRSSSQPTLWAEKTDEVSGEKDRCLDKKCWQNKDVAAAKEKLAEVQAKYPRLVFVETGSCYESEKCRRLKKIYGNVLSSYNYEKAGKTRKGAVPALVVYGKGKGKIIYVKVRKEQSNSSATASGKPKTLKQLRVELEENRWAAVLKEIYVEIMKMKPDDIKHSDKFFIIVSLATGLGIDTSTNENDTTFIKQALDLYEKDVKKAKQWLQAHIWKSTQEAMRYSYTDGNKEEIELGRIIARLFGIDLDEKYKEICERDEFKKPAEWANLKADGTPKEAKPKKEKVTEDKKVRKCRLCGCTEDNPCQTPEGPCHWVKGHGDLCSGCVGKNKKSKKAAKAKKAKS